MNEAPKHSIRLWLRKWLVVALLTYLFVLVLMIFLENSLVFPRETAADHWEDPPDTAIEDVVYRLPNGTSMHGWFLEKPGAAEVVVMCHGNGDNLSRRGNTLLRFREALGCSAFIFDYSGYGKSEGKPTEEGCYDSAEGAMTWLTDVKKFSPKQIIVYGESLGGGVAVEMAKRHDCRALVLLKTFTSLPDAGQYRYPWLPVRWLMRNQFNSLSKIQCVRGPVFIASATRDEITPFAMGKELFNAAPPPKQFMALEGETHNDRITDEFLESLRRFLDEHQ